MRLLVHSDSEKASVWTASYIAEKINAKKNESFVLGLPTGSSPLLIYRELIKIHKDGKLSFKNVSTFNMDEYLGLPANHPQSYRYFMMENFFNHIDIDLKNAHFLDGMTDNYEKECSMYEEAITAKGGIDLFLGGMGSNGHIAFNEPGSSFTLRTRFITLSDKTIKDNSRFFDNDPSKVPSTALTVGIATVMDAREVVIIVTGKNKAHTLKSVVEGEITESLPLSCLQKHPNSIIVCDKDAVEELKQKAESE
jgi:glucosamine-6-phosphate deaminase